jgi:hypothetical protein
MHKEMSDKGKIRGYYIVIPAAVRLAKISSTAKLMYGEIAALANEHGYAWPTNEYFANTYDYTTRTIQTCMSELEQSGFIKVDVVKNNNGTFRRLFIVEGMKPVSYGGVQPVSLGGMKQVSYGHETGFVHNNTSNNTPIENNNFAFNSSPEVEEFKSESQGNLFTADSEIQAKDSEKKKKNPPAQKKEKESDGIQKRMTDFYFEWVTPLLGGSKPYFTGAEGKALKQFVPYLKTLVIDKRKENELPVLEDQALADEVVNGWKYVLMNRSKWDTFRQEQLKVNQIISNWTNILKDLKNGQIKTKPGQTDNRTAGERFQNFYERFSNDAQQ